MTAAIELLGIRRKVEYRLLLEFHRASDVMSNFLVTTIINVFSLSRFSRHEKKGPMSPYGDTNRERVKSLHKLSPLISVGYIPRVYILFPIIRIISK